MSHELPTEWCHTNIQGRCRATVPGEVPKHQRDAPRYRKRSAQKISQGRRTKRPPHQLAVCFTSREPKRVRQF